MRDYCLYHFGFLDCRHPILAPSRKVFIPSEQGFYFLGTPGNTLAPRWRDRALYLFLSNPGIRAIGRRQRPLPTLSQFHYSSHTHDLRRSNTRYDILRHL